MNKDPVRQTLSKSYKKSYPFRTCAPSFIYPADYVANVMHLGPYLDEIELLLFEGDFEKMPSQAEINALQNLSERFDLGYHVHLPIDIDLGASNPGIRQHAVAIIRHICDLTRPLKPSTYTIHLPVDKNRVDSRAKMDAWQALMMNSLEQIMDRENTGRKFSVETLDYPLEWVRPILEGLDLSICLDIGHILLYNGDVGAIFQNFQDRISIIHLHGVENGKDHQSLEHLPAAILKLLVRLLEQFSGVLCFEVFSFARLQESLETFAAIWSKEVRPSPPILFEGLT